MLWRRCCGGGPLRVAAAVAVAVVVAPRLPSPTQVGPSGAARTSAPLPFAVFVPPHVSAVTPAAADLARSPASFVLTISGSSFINSDLVSASNAENSPNSPKAAPPSLHCRFRPTLPNGTAEIAISAEMRISAAVWVAPDTLTCPPPVSSMSVPASLAVDVSVDGGRSYSDETSLFTLYSSRQAVNVTAVKPRLLPVGTADVLTVAGSNFAPKVGGAAMRCEFGRGDLATLADEAYVGARAPIPWPPRRQPQHNHRTCAPPQYHRLHNNRIVALRAHARHLRLVVAPALRDTAAHPQATLSRGRVTRRRRLHLCATCAYLRAAAHIRPIIGARDRISGPGVRPDGRADCGARARFKSRAALVGLVVVSHRQDGQRRRRRRRRRGDHRSHLHRGLNHAMHCAGGTIPDNRRHRGIHRWWRIVVERCKVHVLRRGAAAGAGFTGAVALLVLSCRGRSQR